MSLRIRKGTEQQRLGIVFDMGEIIWTTDGQKLYVGDGVTYGGINVAAQLAGTGLSFDAATGTLKSSATFTTDDIEEGNNNKYFSPELAQEAIWTALQAGQSLGNVIFGYDDFNNKLYANLTLDGVGILSVSQDVTPELGGNLNLASHNITGTGDINITGTLAASLGLGSDLSLNNHNITGTGNINVAGTVLATQGLGGNLNLNTHNIIGTGGISISGTITTGTGLGGDLSLNSHTINGAGNISITGNMSVFSAGATPDSSIIGYSITDGLLDNPGWIDVVLAKGDWTAPTNPGPGDWLGGYKISTFVTDTTKPVGVFGAEIASTANINDPIPATNVYIGAGNVDAMSLYKFRADGIFEPPGLKISHFTTVTIGTLPAEEGLIVFDSDTKQFKGHNGTTWGSVVTNGSSALFADGTASAPSIGFSTDGSTDTGFFHPGDGILCVAVDATEKVRIDGGGMRVSGFMKVANVNGTLPNPPEEGMIVLDGTTFKGYTSGGWVDLN